MTSKRPGRVGTKPAAPKSLAYVLSQGSDLKWSIVFRSGPSATVDGKPLDPNRPDYEVGGLAGAMEAMEGIAEDRERFALALPGEQHTLFLAVPATDLPDYGLAC